jgi:hypothetical protein
MHDALEELFRQFNLEHPQDFYGHSLSVSDLVMLVSAKESVKNRVHPFYCDSWGWKEVKTKGVVRRGA